MLGWIKEKILNVKATTNTNSFTNSEFLFKEEKKVNPEDRIVVMDKTTIDYILNKYKKEMNKYLLKYSKNNLEDKLTAERIVEINTLINLLITIINDDYFKGSRVLKNNIEKVDSYICSQYRKKDELKLNIYKLLTFLNNKKFGVNVRDNFKEYINLINASGLDVFGLLRDYYMYLEDFEKHKKITYYLGKKYNFESNLRNINEDEIKKILKRDIADIEKLVQYN